MSLPASLPTGYLPPGIYRATLEEIVARFGAATPRRQTLAARLQMLLLLARATGRLHRAFVWGSFVTEKPFPGDLDVFLLMQAGFDQALTTFPLSNVASLITDGRDYSLKLMCSGRLKPSARKNLCHG